MDENGAQLSSSPPEVERMTSALAETARRYGVLLACEPVAEGIVASVGVGYLAHLDEGQLELCRADCCQPHPGQVVLGPLDAASEGATALTRRVLEGFQRKNGRECARRAALACASDESCAPEAVHRYLRLGFSQPWEVRPGTTDKRVLAVDELSCLVLRELESAQRLTRFSRAADGSLVAAIEPAANIVPLLGARWAQRLGSERFCLADPRHRVAAFHEARAARCVLVGLDERLCGRLRGMEMQRLTEDERLLRALWKRFREHAALSGRGPQAHLVDRCPR
ncbi:DUF4130 domain-containing protein [Thermophilibacter provencensis]|uniref:DUF4130 domain-containing protein n=1 Tax=Thermophilibacter provencensis TaxID=1852386 RepID=A0ABT7V443_9ACTN|nr:DUF4130 domain-containing protein [Thermophilibacter provencensis]MDM8271360.1 DUF4130 domain-containing protein [Thermophilibacter provencensis]